MKTSGSTAAFPVYLVAVFAAAACGGEEQAPTDSVATVGQALGGSLSNTLAGEAIGGRVPEGDAKVERYAPNTLQLRVKDVGLPDGTVLRVSLAGYDLGAIEISGGEGEASIPVGFQVGINSAVVLRLGSAIVMANAGTWR